MIIIIGIIVSISRAAQKNGEKRPGQGNSQQPAKAPERAPQPVTPPAPVPPPVPSASYAAPAEPARAAVLDETDYARSDLSEGDSRECDHGSVGGSMDITTHQGQGDEYQHARQQVKVQVKAHVKPAAEEKAPVIAPHARLTAEEMRRAVVMSEILKRPAERAAFGRRTVR